MATHIFISYKTEERAFALRLRDQLMAWDFKAWVDYIEILPGTNWDDEIDKALKGCEIVLGVMSPLAVNSSNVMNEWAWALSNNKPLIPLKIAEVSPSELSHRIIRIQYIDFTQDEKRAFEQLHQRLIKPATLWKSPFETVEPTKKVDVTALPDNNRNRMLQRIYHDWVEGVLEKSLYENDAIELGVASKPDAVLRYTEYPGEYTLPSSASIYDIFKDTKRRLLILGEPGSGKTFTLLQLTRELINRAYTDTTLPIPIVFNLSSWAQARQSLDEWLIHELRTKQLIPKKVATDWVHNGEIAPMLDGLDEVSAVYRDDCVTVINAFCQKYEFVDLVVCSRSKDYENLTIRLNLYGAILLQPLSSEQINHYLKRENLAGLCLAVENDPILYEMAQSPFLLNTMRFTYAGLSVQGIGKSKTLETRRNALLNEYVNKRFKQNADSDYTQLQARHYLAWLAGKIVKHEQTVFHIEDMQPTWVETKHWRKPFGMLNRLVMGLWFGLLGVLFLAWTGLCGWVLGVLIYGLLGWLLGGSDEIEASHIDSTEKVVYDGKIIGLMLIIRLAGGLWVGLLGGLILTWVGLGGGLWVGLAVGLVGGLLGGLVSTLEEGVETSQKIKHSSIPNHGMRLTFRNVFQLGLLLTILWLFGWRMLAWGVVLLLEDGTKHDPEAFKNIQFLSSIMQKDIYTILGGIEIGLGAALYFGGINLLRHSLLRLLLYRQGNIPMNYAKFLDYAASIGIMRKVGGGYVFIHRMLLDYFAEKE